MLTTFGAGVGEVEAQVAGIEVEQRIAHGPECTQSPITPFKHLTG